MSTENKNIFFDTTAQILRLSGVKEIENKITRVLTGILKKNPKSKLYSSSIIYGEFLATIVRDILLVRDIVINTFLKNNVFVLSIFEIEKSLEKAALISTNRIRRLFVVTSTLKRRFSETNNLETRRIIRFLDSISRDLAFRDFFRIRIEGEKRRIELIDKNSNNAIECLVNNPLQSPIGKSDDEIIRLLERNVYNFDRNTLSKKLYYLDFNAPITNCSRSNSNTNCKILNFLKDPEIQIKFKKIIQYAVAEKFSAKFSNKRKNKRLIEILQGFADKKNEEFQHLIGKNCLIYFSDVLTILQCPDNTVILSGDDDFDELGKIIERPDIRLVI